MANIKIFVSHRIDIESEVIDNDIYIPVRCGAYFDKNENIKIIGDNTGDNISEKREHYCEFTVQYWAWKNVEADYYGLCHYRRYLSFADQPSKVDIKNQIIEPFLNEITYKKYGLDNQEKIESIIQQYDAIVADSTNIQKIATPNGYKKNIYEHWKACDNVLIKAETLDLLIENIDRLYPNFSGIAKEYLYNKEHIGYNCFILKKELFNQLCEFQFDILNEIENKLDTKYYHETQNRTIGYLGEILYGIFIYYLQRSNKYKIKFQQLIFFENTEVEKKILKIENRKPILITTSNEMIPFLEVQLQSLIKYNSIKFDLILMHYNVTNDNQKKITKIFNDISDSEIRFYNPENWLAKNDICLNTKDISDILMFIPYIFDTYDRLFCINGYTFVQGDISDLFEINFNNNYILATNDYHFSGWYNTGDKKLLRYVNDKLQLKNPYNYIDNGIVIFNNKLIKENIELENLQKLYKRELRDLSKDTLNIVMDEKVKFLDGKWNYCIYTPEEEKHLNYFNPKHFYERRKINKLDFVILHFAYGAAPWERMEVPLSEYFWNIARECYSYEQILGRVVDNKLLNMTINTKANNKNLAIDIIHKLLPKNSRRNSIIRKIFPEGSKRFRILAKLVWK